MGALTTIPTVTVGNATKKSDYDNLVNLATFGATVDGSSGITLTTSQIGMTVIVNSSSDRTVNLPSVDSSHIGATFTIWKLGAGKVTIDAADSDTIMDSSAGGTISNSASTEIWACIKLRLETATQWGIQGGVGTWTTT
jgi:hypothetical protein